MSAEESATDPRVDRDLRHHVHIHPRPVHPHLPHRHHRHLIRQNHHRHHQLPHRNHHVHLMLPGAIENDLHLQYVVFM